MTLLYTVSQKPVKKIILTTSAGARPRREDMSKPKAGKKRCELCGKWIADKGWARAFHFTKCPKLKKP